METIKLDEEKLQKAAEDAAMRGAIKEIEDYYTGYDSPFRKSVKKKLESMAPSIHFELPDILGLINDKLANEIDKIANNFVNHSVVQNVTSILVGVDKDLKLSDVFRDCIKEADLTLDEDSVSFGYEKHTDHGWLSCDLQLGDKNYQFTLHEFKHEDKPTTYKILSTPRLRSDYSSRSGSTYKVTAGNAVVELPYISNIVADKVITYLTRLIISGTNITVDCDGISDDMFPERECFC